jgi:hypothetical protein
LIEAKSQQASGRRGDLVSATPLKRTWILSRRIRAISFFLLTRHRDFDKGLPGNS